MNAKEAREITDKTLSIPAFMRILILFIKAMAKSGSSFCHYEKEKISDEQEEWLKNNGYIIEQTKCVFGAGNPRRDAVKISW